MECYSRFVDTLAHYIRDVGLSHWPEPRGVTENGSAPAEFTVIPRPCAEILITSWPLANL